MTSGSGGAWPDSAETYVGQDQTLWRPLAEQDKVVWRTVVEQDQVAAVKTAKSYQSKENPTFTQLCATTLIPVSHLEHDLSVCANSDVKYETLTSYMRSAPALQSDTFGSKLQMIHHILDYHVSSSLTMLIPGDMSALQ